MIDRWESQIAEGKEVDLLEAFDRTELTRISNMSHRSSKKYASATSFGDMDREATTHAVTLAKKKGLNPF